MARHAWTVVCYKSSVDKDEGQISLLAVTERLNVSLDEDEAKQLRERTEEAMAEDKAVQFPTTLHIVSWWVRTDYEKPETVDTRYRIVAPDGWEFPEQTHTVDLSETTGHRVRWVLNYFLFRGFGLYWIILESKRGKKWKEETRVPLEILGKVVVPRDEAD